jgi:DnaJ-domain-containing protein 1
MLFGNSITATVAMVATPLLYFAHRATLYREHRLQVLDLKAFAITDPDRLIQDGRDEAASLDEGPDRPPPEVVEDWRCVLGVAATATIEDVKQAYKALVKKSHPDRVQDMSPALVALAEVEMKKLNAAYAEAVTHFQLQQPVYRRQSATAGASAAHA